ncbi:MAG: hypothetical protein GC192_20725 [Bacteroidetes bacterium]|nr:hypothetical protein [Bacteroidota bacterium]
MMVLLNFACLSYGIGQNLDTNLVLANSKLKFLTHTENYVYSGNDLCKFGSCNKNFRRLKTLGIKDMFFFELILDSIKVTDTECFAAFCCLYHGTAIFAYDIPSNSIFFINNENVDEWRRFLSVFRVRLNQYDLKNKKSFMNDVFIESANMRTLFKEVNHISKIKRKFSFKKNYQKLNQISWDNETNNKKKM